MRGWARAESRAPGSRSPEPPPDWAMTSRCSSRTSSVVRWRIGLRQPPVEFPVLLQDVSRSLGEIPAGAAQPLLDADAQQLLGGDAGLSGQLSAPLRLHLGKYDREGANSVRQPRLSSRPVSDRRLTTKLGGPARPSPRLPIMPRGRGP